MNAAALLTEIMHTNVAPVAATLAFSEIPGWDSLKMVNMVVRLEQVLDRELAESELETLNTVGDLDALLQAK
ncbi:MAG TPA: acyl carrier protein [Terriglobia bacterium]|nr:acyl carrier protein [Terriglobia bacterium]